MSLCNQVLDVADDINKELLKQIMAEATPPDMVKTAQVATRDVQEKFTRSDFALIAITKEGNELRKFPINDAANTWLSMQYFLKTSSKLPGAASRLAANNLKIACDKFGIKSHSAIEDMPIQRSTVYHEGADIAKIASRIAVETVKQDDSKHFYALDQRYPMANAEFVKKAGQYFVTHEKEFSDPAQRHEFANNVLERAKELQVALEQKEVLEKYAGAEFGDILETQIRMRHDLLQARPDMDEALTKVASYKKELVPLDFAKLLHTFDKKASLDKYYGGYLADAYKSTFETRFTKVASGYSWESADGSSISEKELTKTFEDKYDTVKGYFGSTVAEQLKKHGCQIFASLPKDAKEVITKIAKGQI